MPPVKRLMPASLERQCIDVYIRSLHQEIRFVSALRAFEGPRGSWLLRQSGLASESLRGVLRRQLSLSLEGILHEIVISKMVEVVVAKLHTVVPLVGSKQEQVPLIEEGAEGLDEEHEEREATVRALPLIQLFELLLHP